MSINDREIIIHKSNIMLENIANLNGVEVLQKDQLKNVLGGKWMTCTCKRTGYTFSWNYLNVQQMIDDVHRRCDSGATCKSDAALAAEQ
ncbi:hypothetical protein [Aquimarina litoralis]|uniref:hypothetical protein n=1 Tax=Aquimarina litoralis TaxID=584605 RepID=UPI001C57EC70|nr:hypothetical protein [Aquimarina litoralis]MBW1297127.1 hypothetical protein [Aquimarina litoralis]